MALHQDSRPLEVRMASGFQPGRGDKQRPDSLASTRAESDRIQVRKGSVLLLNKDTKKLDLIGLF